MNGRQDMRSEEVAELIESAFSRERYPGDSHLTQGPSMEAAELREFLRGKRWRDLQLEELVRNRESIFFMTPEALRYYIPAFLIASVRHYADSDQIPSTLLFLLDQLAMNNSDYQSRFRERFESFSDSERAAIRAFLEYIRDTHLEDFPSSAGKDQVSQVHDWWTRHEW